MRNILKVAIHLILIAIAAYFLPSHAASEFKNDQNYSKPSEQNYSHTHKKLSLTYCFDKANRDNKEIEIGSNVDLAEAAIIIAKAIPNPTYNLTYGWGPAWRFVVAGNDQQFGWNEEIQVAGKRTKKINVAKADYQGKLFEAEAIRFDIHNRVRRAYAELAVATAYAGLIRSQLITAKQLLDISQNRYDASKTSESELLQAQLNLTQLDIQSNQAKNRLIQDSARLAFLLGETPKNQEIINVEENGLFNLSIDKSGLIPNLNLGIPKLDQLLPAAWQQRKDLKAAIQQAYTDRKALTLAKAKRIPDPYIGFAYLFSTYQPYQLQYYTPQPNAIQVPFQAGYLLSVVHETPIFYQYQGEINRSKAIWNQQLQKNEQLRSQIATDVVASYEGLKSNRENIRKFLQEILPAAIKSSQISQQDYESGKTDLTTSILSQQQLGQLWSSYFDSVVLYQNNWVDLEKAVGIPLNLR